MNLLKIIIKKWKLKKPIFVVGCARSGTTLLSAPLYYHPSVGPKPIEYEGIPLQMFVDRLLEYDRHLEFSEILEKKNVWYEFFGQERVFTDMGQELIVEECTKSLVPKIRLFNELFQNFNQERLLSKAPTNSFRVKAIKQLFPDAKIVVIFRNGLDVVNSWGNRPYGFSKIGYEKSIDLFAAKWNETIDYLLKIDDEIDIFKVKYEDLIENPTEVFTSVIKYCELDSNAVDISDIKLAKRNSQWKENIPGKFHEQLISLPYKNCKKLGYEIKG